MTSTIVVIKMLILSICWICAAFSAAVVCQGQQGALPQNLLSQYLPSSSSIQLQSLMFKRIGCQSTEKSDTLRVLQCLDTFVQDQLNPSLLVNQQANERTQGTSPIMFVAKTGSIHLPQSYRSGWDYVPTGISNVHQNSYLGVSIGLRSDIYDASMTALYLIQRGQLDSSQSILDSILLLLNSDDLNINSGTRNVAGNQLEKRTRDFGRLRSSYAIIRSKDTVVTAVRPDTLTGDLAFVMIALCRYYSINPQQNYKYLKGALEIGNFIENNLKVASGVLGGYSAGFKGDDESSRLYYRSTEHNIAFFSAARLLYSWTKDVRWKDMMKHCELFISNMYNEVEGAYMTGTADTSSEDDSINVQIMNVNCQVWKVLSDADDKKDRNVKAIKWVLRNAYKSAESQVDEDGIERIFSGITSSRGANSILIEMTASTAMALHHLSKQRGLRGISSRELTKKAKELTTALKNIQKYAANSDGHGMVATVNLRDSLTLSGDETRSETRVYFPLLHTLSTVWTGLSLQMVELNDEYANPFSTYGDRVHGRGGLTSWVTFGSSTRVPQNSQHQILMNLEEYQKMSRMATTALIMALLTITSFFAFLIYRGMNKYLSQKRRKSQHLPFSDITHYERSPVSDNEGLRITRKMPLPRRLEGLMMSPTPRTPTPATPTV